MSLLSLTAPVGDLVEGTFPDLCDLEDVRYANVDGEQKRDDTTTVIYKDVPVSYEPLTKIPQQQVVSGTVSASANFQLTFKARPEVLKIRKNFLIRMHPNPDTGREELLFEEPGRLDFSYSPLVAVAAVLRNK